EDVVTTGGSVKEVKELVESMGGIVVGIGSIVNRSNGKADFGVPFKSVIAVNVESWEPDQCPLCKEGKTKAIKPGSRSLGK
ncbi:MAG: orotate phosphoribosyltransferase, partial [Oscillospiraceae bacterium]